MVEQSPKYGFPLFTSLRATKQYLKLDRNRVSDLWALLDYVIKLFLKNKNQKTEAFLLSLHDQAKYFYKAAESAPMRSQPLLYYYSFLNLSKIYLCIVEGATYTDVFMHGIETKVDATTTIQTAEVKVKAMSGSPNLSVAHLLMTSLKDGVNPLASTAYNVKSLLASCVGIHRTYCETYGEQETFVRLLDPKCYRDGKKFIFESPLKGCDATLSAQLSAQGYNIIRRGDVFFYQEEESLTRYHVNFNDWVIMSDRIRQKRIWSYMDGSDYRLYVSCTPKEKISSISVIYDIMFFLGSVTRYHPYFFDSLMDEKEQWLISEFLTTQPQQFLYYIISSIVCKPILRSRTVGL